MDETCCILRLHAARYPLMQPQDAVKLLYQSTFGGGHLIRNRAQCLLRLEAEYAATPQQADLPLCEELGGALVRVQLGALDACHISPQMLCTWFIDSAARCSGRMDVFEDKLRILEAQTAAGLFGFSGDALSAYLRAYCAAGCPAVSHSEIYRRAYAPAYRVVLRGCLPPGCRPDAG